MNPLALEFREVTVRYEPKDTPVIDAVSFSLEPGQRVALTGLNGSGKTTLLAAAVGLVPHEGEILVQGERMTRQALPGIRDRIGFLFNVPEDQLLFPRAIDDAAFGLLRRGVSLSEANERAKCELAALGIEHLAKATVHHLSHGQKQRVALAGALVTEPSLLLLDEPSAGLDPPGKKSLAKILSRLDAAMIIATHDLEFAARFCTRFLTIDKGGIVLDKNDAAEVSRQWQSI